jgi:RNA polymerase sigma-70 factor (sigma-E family)
MQVCWSVGGEGRLVAAPSLAVPSPLAGGVPAGVSADVAGGATAGEADAGAGVDVEALVVELYRQEAVSLVRLARLFVDDRNAAEDLVQEAFIRLSRAAHRIRERGKAPAYLRSIVLNLARDHNRRGLVSLRQQLPMGEQAAPPDEDVLVLQDEQQRVLDALRDLPLQQRNCVVLRHYEELGIADIAETLGISQNSVKTHLKRGMASLARTLALPEEDEL